MAVLHGCWADSHEKTFPRAQQYAWKTASAQDMGVSFPSTLPPSEGMGWTLSSLNITWPAEGKGHITVAEESLEMVEALLRIGPPSHFSRVCSYPFHPLHSVTRGQDHCLSLYFLIQELAAVGQA